VTAAAHPARDFGILIALGCVACGGAAIGLAFPLLAYNLDDWGVSEAGIGLFTLASAVSTVIATPFIPPLLGRFSIRTVLATALMLIALAFSGYLVVQTVPAWFGFRFMAGVAFSLLFVSCEAWALDRAPPDKRGLVMGMFASTFAGAMALGGTVVAFVGYTGVAPFAVGGLIAMLGLFLLLLPGRAPPPPEGESASPKALWERMKTAPIVMAAPLAMGAIETAKYNLIPIYARRIGFADEVGAAMITAAGLGVLVMQPLLGLRGETVFGVLCAYGDDPAFSDRRDGRGGGACTDGGLRLFGAGDGALHDRHRLARPPICRGRPRRRERGLCALLRPRPDAGAGGRGRHLHRLRPRGVHGRACCDRRAVSRHSGAWAHPRSLTSRTVSAISRASLFALDFSEDRSWPSQPPSRSA
jgi:MFS family permease